MSFWNTSTGEDVSKTATTEFDAGGDFELIPDGSSVLAAVSDVGWEKDKSFNEYINVKWKVLAPESLAGRVVWQKIWAKDPEPNALKKGTDAANAKRDKAIRMLAAIDANAGGKLGASGGEPTSDQLMIALVGKPMVITVKVWEMDTADGKKQGNWVAAVNPKSKELKIGKAPDAPASNGSFKKDLGDEIPF